MISCRAVPLEASRSSLVTCGGREGGREGREGGREERRTGGRKGGEEVGREQNSNPATKGSLKLVQDSILNIAHH